ncbi:DUF624 domain-containing protein [Enterococcus sp. HY326]|uniref:DUF624 domain-containing protein n=1 Tax=Enterococcus sp. HY326 TaxID=2971265 RepID=UPI00223F2D47|nr:DUF624 domain-containing protein [Enterococcus sp. HY326]
MTTKLMKGLNVIVILILVNVMWLIGTAVGLFIAGLTPSMVAAVKILRNPQLFADYSSYFELLKQFIREYINAFRVYNWRILIPSTIALLLYFDLLIIQGNELLRAMLQWPLLILASYLFLSFINLIMAVDISQESWIKKIKFALVAPILLPLQSICSLLMIVAFFVLVLAYNWLFFVAISVLLYTMIRLLSSGYEQKGLLVVANETFAEI